MGALDKLFSVATELARKAPQAMPLSQWQKYLQPGRMLERGGVRFPLRQDELTYGPMGRLVRDLQQQQTGQILSRFPVKDPNRITSEEFAQSLEQAGSRIPSEGDLGGYPEFQSRVPAYGPQGYAGIPADERPPRMYYEDQHQLIGAGTGLYGDAGEPVQGFGKGGLVRKFGKFIGAALKYPDGSIYHDLTHWDAAAKAHIEGHSVDENPMVGFLTSKGHFLDRGQAGRLLNGEDPFKPLPPEHYYEGFEATHGDMPWAEDLDEYAQGGEIEFQADMRDVEGEYAGGGVVEKLGKIIGAAFKDLRSGKIWGSGQKTHWEVLKDEGPKGDDLDWFYEDMHNGRILDGFLDEHGQFLDRQQALQRAQSINQLDPELDFSGETYLLHSGLDPQKYQQGGPVESFPMLPIEEDVTLAQMMARRRAIEDFVNQIYADDDLQRNLAEAQDAADIAGYTHLTSFGQGSPRDEPPDLPLDINDPATWTPVGIGPYDTKVTDWLQQSAPIPTPLAYNLNNLASALTFLFGSSYAEAARDPEANFIDKQTALAADLLTGMTATGGLTRAVGKPLAAMLGKGYGKGGVVKKLAKIVASAIKSPSGRIYTGLYHGDAVNAATNELGNMNAMDEFLDQLQDWDQGFVDDAGKFLTREQASKRAKQLNWNRIDPYDEGLLAEEIEGYLQNAPEGELKKAKGGVIKELLPLAAAAWKDLKGKVWTGPGHIDALQAALDAAKTPEIRKKIENEFANVEPMEHLGFTDVSGRFLDFNDAFNAAMEHGQLPEGYTPEDFHSSDLIWIGKPEDYGFATGGPVSILDRLPAEARPYHEALYADPFSEAPETGLPSRSAPDPTTIAVPPAPRTGDTALGQNGGPQAPILAPHMLPVSPSEDPVSSDNQFDGFFQKLWRSTMDYLSPAARSLILDAEGMNQPSIWPGGQSGITLGRGYDLGHHTLEEFKRDWGPYLTPEQIGQLSKGVGKTGLDAAAVAPMFKGIHVPEKVADEVFDKISAPKHIEQARRAFPGFDALPSDAQGALVSLVYNRGPTLEGERRKEMSAIYDILKDGVQKGDLDKIAAQIRSMKRLWEGKGLSGLLRRRDREADLVLTAKKQHA